MHMYKYYITIKNKLKAYKETGYHSIKNCTFLPDQIGKNQTW
jgi:hypothetical protein